VWREVALRDRGNPVSCLLKIVSRKMLFGGVGMCGGPEWLVRSQLESRVFEEFFVASFFFIEIVGGERSFYTL